MSAEAFCVPRTFEPSAAVRFDVPQHYLVYAASGRLRLSFEEQTWTLPPTRAALITASTPIDIELPQRVVTSSALFDPVWAPPPAAPLSVFEVTPLVRHLLLACRDYPSPDVALGEEGRALFRALQVVAWKLARSPSCRSSWRELVQRARMIRAVEWLADDPDASITEIATEVGYSSPSAFNAAFRAFSGGSPTAWRRSVGLDVPASEVVDEQE